MTERFPEVVRHWPKMKIVHSGRKFPSKRRIKARLRLGRSVTMKAIAYHGLANFMHSLSVKYDRNTETVKRVLP